MGASVRILHLDDNPADAQLVSMTLEAEQGRLPCTVTFVQTKEEFLAALERKDFDVILSDFRMPAYDGDQALATAKEVCPEIPFIMVTGELGEDLVIETLKRGATDYVLKDRMFRLVPAIERALAEAENNRKRREAERESQKREGELWAVIQAMRGGVTVLDTEGNVVLVNDAQVTMFGYNDAAELKHNVAYFHNILEFADAEGHVVPPEDWPVSHIMRGATVVNRELKAMRKDSGREWILSFSGQPVRDENGKQILSVLVARDITERKKVEQELRNAQRTTSEILESVQDPFYTLDLEWRFTYVNEKAREYLDKSPGQLIGKRIWDVFPNLSGSQQAEALQSVATTRTPLHFESRSVIKDVWIDVRVFPKADGGISVLYRDITERKKQEEALRSSEERFAATFMGSPYPLALSRVRDGMVLEANAALLKLYGAEREDVVGKTTFELGIWPDLRERERYLDTLRREGKVYESETTLKRGTGEERRIRVTVTLLLAGVEPTVLSVLTDITERNQAEERLMQSEELSRLALAAGKAGAWSWDRLTNSERWSDDFYRIFGLEPGSIAPDPEAVRSQIHPEDRERVASLIERARTKGGSIDVVHRVIWPDGSLHWVRAMVKTFVEGEDPAPVRLVGLAIDITPQMLVNQELEKRVQKRTAALQQANEDLEAFGYSVSHDLNAPLRLIAGFVELLMRQAKSNLADKEKEYLATIRQQVIHMQELIKALLEFSRLTSKDVRRVGIDAQRMVEDVVSEQRQLAGEDAGERVTVDIGELPKVEGDPVLLRMVFANLLSNAFKFTRTVKQPKITVEAGRTGDFYSFRISDNGVGFPRGRAERLFKVFQRLHGQGESEASGIGLANVRKIVERHGGQVCGDGEEGKGAVFSFTLPVAARLGHTSRSRE